eukprot:3927818-Rhodomonas_salina.1
MNVFVLAGTNPKRGREKYVQGMFRIAPLGALLWTRSTKTNSNGKPTGNRIVGIPTGIESVAHTEWELDWRGASVDTVFRQTGS